MNTYSVKAKIFGTPGVDVIYLEVEDADAESAALMGRFYIKDNYGISEVDGLNGWIMDVGPLSWRLSRQPELAHISIP